MTELAEAALSAQGQTGRNDIRRPESVGSLANPFMAAVLPGSILQEMVRLDALTVGGDNSKFEAGNTHVEISRGSGTDEAQPDTFSSARDTRPVA